MNKETVRAIRQLILEIQPRVRCRVEPFSKNDTEKFFVTLWVMSRNGEERLRPEDEHLIVFADIAVAIAKMFRMRVGRFTPDRSDETIYGFVPRKRRRK